MSLRSFSCWLVIMGVLLGWLRSDPACAQGESSVSDFQLHGFASQGFLFSRGNNYLAESKDGSFEFAEVGLNFTKQLGDRLRTGVQLFARDVGPIGNYSAKVDWFYLDYRWRDWLGLRAGRIKMPFGLYNDVNDIDAARVAVLLPQSIYPVQNRDFLLAQTGVELYGYASFGVGGALDYRVYSGTIFTEQSPPYPPLRITRNWTSYLVGGRVLWETPAPGLRVGGSVLALKLNYNLQIDADQWQAMVESGALPASFRGSVSASIPAVLGIGSVEYTGQRLQLAGEYSQWYVDLDSSMPVLFPGGPPTAQAMVLKPVTSERYYVMASYQVHERLALAGYYAGMFRDASDRSSARENHMHDFAAALRVDVTPYWLVKLEAHLVDGTAGLSSSLNGNQALSSLDRRWTMFLAKTTVYF